MISFRSISAVLLTALTSVLFAVSARDAAAQQITYYNFDTPATTSPQQYSYACSISNPSSNPFFCFNYQGSYQDPSFLQDPAGSGSWATQMTYPQGGQAASMWFSLPQVVAGGFNTWFEFKITPSGNSGNTADGLAFVIQNAQGGTAIDANTNCGEIGQGPTVVGGGGGCIGYSGIDNSLALEFDTYYNSPWDPYQDTGEITNNDNHIALQNCGPGLPNSSAHLASNNGSGCLVNLAGPDNTTISTLITGPTVSAAPPAPATAVTLADGNVHQVVVVYNGPNDMPRNYLYVYLDPAFNPGTVTPVTGSVPLFSGPYDITQAMNLLTSATGTDSAYVGFTAGTGAAFEQHEIMGWTFTPHTPVTQQQPLNPPVPPTSTTYQQFPFGTHTYGVQYNTNSSLSTPTTGITMTLTANTVSPNTFNALIAPTPYAGSKCQIYDDTGGNCVIYSVSCSVTATGQSTPCPAVTNVPNCSGGNAAECIAVKTTYNSSQTPVSPGFIQGDPFYSQISSIVDSGGTGTVTCTGECSVTTGQTVTILGAVPADLNGTVTVLSADPNVPNTFTFSTNVTDTSTTGGYLTSTNVQNIFTSWVPQNIDGTTKGTTTNFSDFVFTSLTVTPAGITLSANSTTPTEGQADQLTAVVTGTANANQATPTGTVTFTDGTSTCGPVPLVPSGTAQATAICSTYNAPNTPGGLTLTATYSGDSNYNSNVATLPMTIQLPTVQVAFSTSPSGLAYSVDGTPYIGPQTLTLQVGSHTIATASPQTSGGVQNTWSSWSDGGAISHSVNVTLSTTSYTASFSTAYQLTTAASPANGGTVTPATGSYYAANTVVNLSAIPNTGYVFSSWTGNVASASSASTTTTMGSAPQTVTANFAATTQVSVGTSVAGLSFTVDGVPYASTHVFTWTVGTPHTIATTSPQPGATGTQYVWAGWSDGGAVSHTVTASSSVPAYTATFNTQYQLSTAANPIPGGTVSPATGAFYNAGSVVPLIATANSGYAFSAWTGAVASASSASTTVTMSAPETVTANFTTVPVASISPSNISFGTSIFLGSILTHSVTITNTGNAAMTISDPFISLVKGGDSSEFVAINLCPKSLAVGKSCIIEVVFLAGPFYTPQTATLTISDNAPGSPQTVPLTATVIDPVAQFSASSLSFGTAKTNSGTVTKSVTLTSAGGTALSITKIAIGADTADFSETNTCSTAPMAPKATCTISVTFKPVTKTSHSGTLVVTSNAQNSPQSIPLSGTGN